MASQTEVRLAALGHGVAEQLNDDLLFHSSLVPKHHGTCHCLLTTFCQRAISFALRCCQ